MKTLHKIGAESKLVQLSVLKEEKRKLLLQIRAGEIVEINRDAKSKDDKSLNIHTRRNTDKRHCKDPFNSSGGHETSTSINISAGGYTAVISLRVDIIAGGLIFLEVILKGMTPRSLLWLFFFNIALPDFPLFFN
uniref:Uncharacterized protein n=1 Tax=Timema cristinae TaxID=61476 RepID=A0A7R9DE03_TIMCR|nr:unnamed protein product [Timema cristinae]